MALKSKVKSFDTPVRKIEDIGIPSMALDVMLFGGVLRETAVELAGKLGVGIQEVLLMGLESLEEKINVQSIAQEDE